ncbi:transcription antitermination factor NusB [Wansuia hejianensis]|uniref:Transcription antitermination protein NusB n=1 Tax=Wansuia hejianensis TaxID=2763667 RepID=A0A926EZK1_9FIRM|nr:transcription antitermination factor NusB [Wansuia hejianensis]MBC8590571.1 transcription antitermination factor NusB [Wansuia hejianensis]
MGRKQAREGTMQILFQMESTGDFSDDALNVFLNNFKYDEMEKKYIYDAISSIKNNLYTIDNHIKDNLEGWSIYRLAKIDLAALRIAIYEILYRDDIPVEVSINEAIEIVKKYSNMDSFKFINGVLGGFVRSIDKR